MSEATAEPTIEIERIKGMGPKGSQELMAIPASANVMAVLPRSFEEVFRLGQLVATANWAPDSFKSDVNKITLALMAALELGVAPLQGLKGIAIINNRPAIWGDLAVALCQSKGLVTDQEEVWAGEYPQDNFGCTYRIWRKGQSKPYEGKFTIADAKLAKLWANPLKKPWIEYPKRMLKNRARAFALRDGFADHLAGMAIAEEAFDLPVRSAGAVEGDAAPTGNRLEFLEDDVAETPE